MPCLHTLYQCGIPCTYVYMYMYKYFCFSLRFKLFYLHFNDIIYVYVYFLYSSFHTWDIYYVCRYVCTLTATIRRFKHINTYNVANRSNNCAHQSVCRIDRWLPSGQWTYTAILFIHKLVGACLIQWVRVSIKYRWNFILFQKKKCKVLY